MIGLADITPPVERFPGRLMNADEQELWNRALRLLDSTTDYVVGLKMLALNAGLTWGFAQNHGLQLSKPVDLETRVLELSKKLRQVKELVRKVEDRELAVQFRGTDIDIVDPNFQGFSGLPLIIAGAIVLTGLIAGLLYYKKEADEVRPKYNNLLKATDKVFCKEGSPETCAEWKAYKKQTGYTQRQTVAEKIFAAIEQPVKTGAKYGTAILLGLVGVMLSGLLFGKEK